MESQVIWIGTLTAIALFFLPYFIKFRRQEKINYERKLEASELGIDKPRAQFPFVDEALCIGCGSCVAACPEHDVLAVVFGKAKVVNGIRCVGHGLCEKACPVGALQVGLGDIKKRPDIPCLNDANETNVPGIYIAGELGGFSLIRNAIAQGAMVVEDIARKRTGSNGIPDVCIVGAGPAGLSAALCCLKNNLSYTIVDQQEPGGTILHYPRRKLVMTEPVEIPLYGRLKKHEYAKEDLLEIWEEIIARFEIEIQTGHKIEQIQSQEDGFHLASEKQSFAAHNVVLALGRRGYPRKLGVPGEDRSKVMYKLIDAQAYHKKNILVVGGGDSAVEAAVGLARQKSNKVYISYRKSKFFRIKKKNEERIEGMIKKGRITPLFNSNVVEIKKDSVIVRIEDTEKEIPNDYVFIFIGGKPPFEILKKAGIRFGCDTN